MKIVSTEYDQQTGENTQFPFAHLLRQSW